MRMSGRLRLRMFRMSIGLSSNNTFGLDETNKMSFLCFCLLENGQSLFSVFKIPNIDVHFVN